MFSKKKLYGVQFADTNIWNCTKFILDYSIKGKGLLQLITVNSSIIVNMKKDELIKSIAQKQDTMIICDGQPIVWASKLMGKPLPQRVGGYDLFINILEEGNKRDSVKVYFIGSKDETLEQVKSKVVSNYPNIKVVGSRNGYLKEEHYETAYREIVSSQPDIIFVGMGSPKQEFFIDKFKTFNSELNAVAIGLGGSFEVFVGNLRRAPLWMQKYGLEWFYRLMQEPKRLFKRYLVTNTLFIMMTIKEIFKGKFYKSI